MNQGREGLAGGPPSEGIAATPPEPTADTDRIGRIRSSDLDGEQDILDDPCILLFMQPGRNRRLVSDLLGEQFDVSVTTDADELDSTFDCCVVDAYGFDRVADRIEAQKSASDPTFLPFVFLNGDGETGVSTDRAWEHVDDVVDVPVDKRALRARVTNLIERRRTSLRLAAREQMLESTVEDLRLKEQALDEAPVGITIAERGEEDNPLVYLNDEFESITGYGDETLGEDCRFLQGKQTDPETTATIRAALDDARPVAVDLLNYRHNGQSFWNRLSISPIRDDDGTVSHFVGFQVDITDRKIRERRLEVMNRVLSHNLRNKMNLISGYAELVEAALTDEDALESLAVIDNTADNLTRIADAVQRVDVLLSGPSSAETAIELRDRLIELRSHVTERYPEVSVSLSLPDDDPIQTTVPGLEKAIEEAVENAAKHNDNPDPQVTVEVAYTSPEWLAIEISDNGPGIPDHETRVLDGGETSVSHADRLGIWLIYWIVSKAGGDFSVDTSSEGTTLRLAVPARP